VDLEFDPHMSEIDLNLSVPLMVMKHFPVMNLGTSNHIWIKHLMHLMNQHQGCLKELLNRVTPTFVYQTLSDKLQNPIPPQDVEMEEQSK